MAPYRNQPLVTQRDPDTRPSTPKQTVYQYQTLPQRTIRLLELLPGEVSASLKCKLIKASITGVRDYEALSYCWGHPGETSWIIVNGSSRLEIWSNLWVALSSLRYTSESRFLWIDAICINQDDDEEKNRQVKMMREIYQKAWRTVVWLGDEPDGEDGLTAVHAIAQRQESLSHSKMSIFPVGISISQAYDLGLIIGLPYFERVWIIQEVAVSSEVNIVCGSGSASWDELVTAIRACDRTALMFQSGLRNILSIAKARERSKLKDYPSILSLLFMYRSFRATDSKDKVYALLGLVDENSLDESGIEPNYHRDFTVENAYVSVAQSLLKLSDNLDVLSLSSQSQLKIPSWVPDWSTADVALPFIDFSHRVEADNHLEVTPAFFSTKDSKSEPKFHIHSRSVCLRGFVVDKVSTVGMAVQPIIQMDIYALSNSENSFNRVNIILSASIARLQQRFNMSWTLLCWEKMTEARTRKFYVTGEDMLDVYWKTLAGSLPREDADIWAEKKAEMEKTTSLERFPFFFRKHLNSVGWAISCWLCGAIGSILILMRLLPLYNPYKTNYHIRRRMFNTQDGYIGLGPANLQDGDQVALFEGGKLPFIIRRKDSEYELIGECYIHGIMSGERYDPVKCGEFWII